MKTLFLPESDSFGWQPEWPIQAILGAGGTVILLVAILLWHERRYARRPLMLPILWCLRTAAVGGTCLILANPSAIRSTRQTVPKHAVLYVDTSGSMGLQDCGNDATHAAKWSLAANKDHGASTLLDEADALLATARANLLKFEEVAKLSEKRDALALADHASRGVVERMQSHQLPAIIASRADILRAQILNEVQHPLDEMREMLSGLSNGKSHPPETARLSEKIAEFRSQVRMLADGITADEAPSHSTGSKPSRLEFVRQWLRAGESSWIKMLAGEVELDRMQFSDGLAPAPADWKVLHTFEGSSATNLQTVLDDIGHRAGNQKIDLAIIVTDGVQNPGQPLTIPEGIGRTPWVVVPIGDHELQRDLDVRSVDAPQRILIRNSCKIRARIAATMCDGEKMIVELREKEKLLDSKQVPIKGKNADQIVDFNWQSDQAGIRSLSVRVRPVEGENILSNNESSFPIAVVDDHLSVLIADHSARWETRYLVNIFRREFQADCTSIIFHPIHAFPGKPLPASPALPLDLQEWQRFSVVVLGDLNPQELTFAHQKVIQSYVENGGQLVVIAGDESMPRAYTKTPFNDLLPVVEAPFSQGNAGFGVRLTRDGFNVDALRIAETEGASANLWQSVYANLPIYDLSQWSKPKPSATVLLEAVSPVKNANEGRGFLVTHRYGKGSVSYFSSPSTFSLRWCEGDRYHFQFWGQLIRALAANGVQSGIPQLRIETDKLTYSAGEPVVVRVRVQADNGKPYPGLAFRIAALSEGKKVAAAEVQPKHGMMGEYETVLKGLAPGEFDLQPEGDALVKLLPAEGEKKIPKAHVSIRRMIANSELTPATEEPPFFKMVPASRSGMLIAPGAIGTVLDHLKFEPVTEETMTRRPLWNEWWLLLSIAGLIGLDWIGRKIAGLP